MISPPIHDELSFRYTLVPLSALLDILELFDVVSIMGFEGNITFEDIVLSGAGGVGWGEKSLWSSEASRLLESLTPLTDLVQ